MTPQQIENFWKARYNGLLREHTALVNSVSMSGIQAATLRTGGATGTTGTAARRSRSRSRARTGGAQGTLAGVAPRR